ncbi:hypothetical protein EMB92_10685 [Bifidobacterium callitrichos]|uniref:Uncharacterized protein n=1 Tax=Bifidobacterium callitrichos TaxID=762209 RepID=A0A5M9Z9E0_9BIFI|nr:hypothetical protein [Bifidobacterium callitrichos]KAA8815128.1 hypothetical protein EMB92_10685 [Bifidobacterium callitrichos]
MSVDSTHNWDWYDLNVLDAAPDIVRDQLATNVRMSLVIVDAICATLSRRIPLIREIHDSVSLHLALVRV